MNRREFAAVAAGACGAAMSGTGYALAGDSSGAIAGGQGQVRATLHFKGLLGLATTADWRKGKVLLLDSSKSSHHRSLPYHRPILTVPKTAVAGTPPGPDDSTANDWIWHLSKRRVSFDGASGDVAKVTTVACPTSESDWRDAAFIGDARKILKNNATQGIAHTAHVSDDSAQIETLMDSPVATQVVLPAGTIYAKPPTRTALLEAYFTFPYSGHRQPMTDGFFHQITPVPTLAIVLTPFRGGTPTRITLTQQAFNLTISNLVPKGVEVSARHFPALFDLVQTPSCRPSYAAFKCKDDTEIPADEWEEESDDPIYCPPLRVHIP